MTCLVHGETHWGSSAPPCTRKRLDNLVSLRPRNLIALRYRGLLHPPIQERDDNVCTKYRGQGEIKQPIAQAGRFTLQF